MSAFPKKICFVMQEATPGTHMDYVFEMARTLREDEGLPLTLLLEKGSKETRPSWVILQRFRFVPFRVIENFVLIARERLRGTKIFYIHYSFLSAITAGIVTKFFGGHVLYWNAGMPWQYKRSCYTNLYQKIAYKLIDTLVTGAESLRTGYMQTYGLKSEQIEIIPNWIDLTQVTRSDAREALRASLNLPPAAPLLLYVHKLAPRKGAQWLVPILKQVKNTECHLVIAGDGSESEAIKKYAQEVGLTDRVHLLGRVNRDTVKELYQSSDIFIMPSHEEGSPHSLIEAMAYGLPSICFAVGGVLDTLPPEAAIYTYSYADTTAFAAGVDTLLYNKEEYTRVQQSMKVWIKQFDKPTAVQKFSELLAQ